MNPTDSTRFSCVRETYRPRDLPLQVEPQSAPETTGAIFLSEALESHLAKVPPRGLGGGVFSKKPLKVLLVLLDLMQRCGPTCAKYIDRSHDERLNPKREWQRTNFSIVLLPNKMTHAFRHSSVKRKLM